MDVLTKLIRSDRRTVSITVDLSGRIIIIRAPYRMPQYQIEQFLVQKEKWIQSALSKIQEQNPMLHLYEEGELFFFLGEAYLLKVTEGKKAPFLSGGNLMIASNRDDKASQVETFYRAQAKIYLPKRARELANRHNICISSVRVTAAKTRFGSCNRQNGLNFSWRIMALPIPVIDSIILHELCHIIHFNHSSLFWQKLVQMDQNCLQNKQWLKTDSYRYLSF